jgi:hypothetical protein
MRSASEATGFLIRTFVMSPGSFPAAMRHRFRSVSVVDRLHRLEAVGLGMVSLYNASGAGASEVVIIRDGEQYDLADRRKQE